MERHDIRMFTSAWKRYYQESIRGCYMPQLGEWSATGGWVAGEQQLHVDGNFINPAPLILIVTGRVRDRDLSVTINYTTAVFSSWETQFYNGKSYKYPLYVAGTAKSKTFTIAAFTDCETVMRICEEDNLIYRINSVTVANNRYDERFFIYALASTTARFIYSQNWHTLYETMVAEKRGLFAAPTVCPTCQGTGLRDSVVCPECGGWAFSGSNATGIMLDKLGRDVGIVRETSDESDESFRKKVWAKRWWLIPTKDEIKRYFKHFCHVADAEIDIIEMFREQDPTFFVCVNPWEMGAGAIWQPGATFEDYDGMVEHACPAGVNGYFAWLGYSQEEGDDNPIYDSVTSQGWMENHDGYGSAFEVSQFLEANFGELLDSTSENMLDDFEGYENLEDIATERPDLWSLVGGTFKCYGGVVTPGGLDFDWADVGTFDPADDPLGYWELRRTAVEMFTNFSDGEDIEGGMWVLYGPTGTGTFKAKLVGAEMVAHYYKPNTTNNMLCEVSFPTTKDMSVKGLTQGDRAWCDITINGSPSYFEVGLARADTQIIIQLKFKTDGKVYDVDGYTDREVGSYSVGSSVRVGFVYMTDTTHKVIVDGAPSSTYTNSQATTWATGNCGKMHFGTTMLLMADVYIDNITTSWLQASGDTTADVFEVEEHTYGGKAHHMLHADWSNVDAEQQIRLQFPAPIATPAGEYLEWDFVMDTLSFQHVFKFYDSSEFLVQEIDSSGTSFSLLDHYDTNGEGFWQNVTFTPTLTLEALHYYRIRMNFLSTTTFSMDVYDYETAVWHYGNTLSYSDSTTAANLDSFVINRQGSSGLHYAISNVYCSWLGARALSTKTPGSGELKYDVSNGEVIGTYPVVSGTAFQNYRAKMDVIFTESAETYQLEAGITEDSMTSDANLRIHLAFKNSDRLVYYHNGTSLVSTGVYWNDPHEGQRVEKFSGYADHTNIDDSPDWAPYTGDKSDQVNCGAEYLAGEGHFYSLEGNGGVDTVAKLYTFPVASGGSGIVNSYIDVRYDIGFNRGFDIAVGGGGVPALYMRLVEDSGMGMIAQVMTGALAMKAIDIDFTMNPLKFKFEMDMDNQTFKIYQQVLGIWSLRTIEDAYDDFWGAIASISLMLFQLTGEPSHVYLSNIANDWDTEVDSCDATFEVAVVAADKFHIRKDDEEWSAELDCKNAFTAGIKHLKLKTTDVDGVQVDDLEYSW